MNVVALRTLRAYWEANPTARAPLQTWYAVTKKAKWSSFNDLRATFNSADYVDGEVIFNIGGNNYRLKASLAYRTQRLYVKWIGTHSEYDKLS
jgi:mRNA interferase HigB